MTKVATGIKSTAQRWVFDLKELTSGVLGDPLAVRQGRLWSFDFAGEIGPADVRYAVLLVVLSLIPAALIAATSSQSRMLVMANLFRAPLQVAISGFLASIFVFAASHLNRVPKPYPVAFKLMLRIMSIHPLLGFLLFARFGEPVALLIFGFFVIRGVRKTYAISVQRLVFFFGLIYFMFALMQFNAALSPQRPNDEFRLPEASGSR